MKSRVIKRSMVIAGHRTSVSIEEAFWQALKDIAISRQTTRFRTGGVDRSFSDTDRSSWRQRRNGPSRSQTGGTRALVTSRSPSLNLALGDLT
jgi:hypothetical protein